MKSRMALADGDESPAAGRTNLVVRYELGLDGGAGLSGFDNVRAQVNLSIARRRTQQFHMKIRRHGAVWFVLAVTLHQKVCCRPVRVTI